MTRLQAIMKYAASPCGCRGCQCVRCALNLDVLCIPVDRKMHVVCQQYIAEHPDEFTIENLTEELL